jgi:YihY family inner membrane protein
MVNRDREGKRSSGGILGPYHRFMERHPKLKAFIIKLGKDNVGMLAGNLSWNLLTSLVPLIVGLVAITGAVMHDPATRKSVVDHIAAATQGFSRQDIDAILKGSGQHAGLLGIIGFLGVLWGGSNVGGAISTVFQAIFEVRGRPFVKEKLIDIGMIFIFAALMIVIILGSTASALVSGLIARVPVPGVAQAVGILVDLLAAFLLFAAIYLVFPNIRPPFRFGNVWKGALVASVLFTILSQVWGIYADFQHFSKYGQVVSVLLILIAWIYFFSVILVMGAEVVAFGALEEARKEGRSVGPEPQESVPQHDVLRKDPALG